MAETFSIDASELETLKEIIENYESEGLRVINDVIHSDGAEIIKENIQRLLPESGRQWKKKKTAARQGLPFTKEDDMLAVTVKTIKTYNYLYFPDDGSNTKKHVGNQEFMRRGAEESYDAIISRCLGRLIERG